MMLLTLAENAVKHGVQMHAGICNITIKIQSEPEWLSFHIANDKPLRKARRSAGGIGLATMRRRLEMLFENHPHYIFESGQTPNTYWVELRLPLNH